MDFNKLKTSNKTSILGVEQNLCRYHLCCLTPDEVAPCSIYLFFKGKYIEMVKRDEKLPVETLAKLYNYGSFFFYVSERDEPILQYWLKRRYRDDEYQQETNTDKRKLKIDANIKKCLEFAKKCIRFNEENVTTEKFIQNALNELRTIFFHPSLEWFFETEMDKDRWQHLVRVSYSILLFIDTKPDLKERINLLSFITGSLAHEFHEMPFQYKFDDVAEEVLSFISLKQIPLNAQSIEIVKSQNHFLDSNDVNDLPWSKLIFSVFNYFDHLKIERTDLTKSQALIEARKKIDEERNKFHPEIYKAFWDFNHLIKYDV